MVRGLYGKGRSITEFSQETDFDPKTIRKFIKNDELPKRKKFEPNKGLKTTTTGLPTQSSLQSTEEIVIEQRSIQVYDQLESGNPL